MIMKQKKIRILAIAPYENLKKLMLETVKEFDDIELNVFVGDLEQGVLIAQHNFYNDYDMIVSRGGTASLLKEQLNLPLIEIEVSSLDIVRTMKTGGALTDNYAIIGFPNITSNAQVVCQMMESDIDIYSINQVEELEDILRVVSQSNTHTILCDMVSYTTALKLGLNPILIQSGRECIKNAFVRARQLYYTHQELREENRFLRNLIWKHINHTIVFDEDRAIFFSTLENNNDPIVEFLKAECSREFEGNDCHIIKQISNVRYSIRLTKECLAQKEYTVYYFTKSKVALPEIRRGIRYLGQPEAKSEYESSIYGVVGILNDFQQRIELLNQSEQPLLIFGEDGTCKEQAAKYIYLQSDWRNAPLIIIDCFMLNKKAWNYLMEHHNSPLAQDGCTLYIKNVDTLTAIQRKQMLANLLAMNVCKRNRVLFSCICNGNESVSESGKDILETLCCVTMYLPPVREKKERLQQIVDEYLRYTNVFLQKPLTRIVPEAVELLKNYQWPHNYTQFQRILEELVVMSTDGVIHREDVEAVLKRENALATVNHKAEDVNIRIDLNQSLDKINRDIIYKVLEEENGNRTNVAKRLEISRSTLWRFLNRE